MKSPNKPHLIRFVGYWIIALLLVSCATLNPNFKHPEVSLVNLYALPNSGFEQRFKVVLKIANPNATALKLVGMSYGLTLNGHKIVSGVASAIPEIPAYGENTVELEASVNALTGFRFLSQLFASPQADLNYRLHAELDTGLPFVGALLVEDSGQIALSSASTRNP